ncbi:MAG: copper resistance protein B [Proteobacteria bacterium]|nr:copper resistance protein B [Pseudomonadota bacterium]
MRINVKHIALLVAALVAAAPARAADADMPKHGESGVFHAATADIDITHGREGNLKTWDADGWIGGDVNRLWLASEGDVVDSKATKAELWAMYGRNVSPFWDAQLGVRHDFAPRDTTYLVAGLEGMAPYFFETRVHLFVSEEGDISARVKQELDLPVTQRLITQPHLELNLFAQDVPELEKAAGLAEAEVGLQTRYEITREFAPYLDINYTRKVGENAGLAHRHQEPADDLTLRLGIRLKF